MVTSRQTVALSNWQWMAPEAQLGTNYSHLCDNYSYAIIVSELFTQQMPFVEHRAVRDMVNKILKEGLRPLIPSFVPAWLQALLQGDGVVVGLTG